MMRSLWTAASGMIGQQRNVDVISNNLANVNTTAYKKDRVEFKDLVYAKMDKAYNLENDKPTEMQIGMGTMPAAIVKNFENGTYQSTECPVDFAIEGEGFFTVETPQGESIYTKDGGFRLSPLPDGGSMLVNTQGYPVLDTEGENITFPSMKQEYISVNELGEIYFADDEGNYENSGMILNVVKFRNPAGLESLGSNNFRPTVASGEPLSEQELEEGETRSRIMQGYLETSNVQLVDEMVNLIVAQRAYEINSKIIQASDDMLNQANTLRR